MRLTISAVCCAAMMLASAGLGAQTSMGKDKMKDDKSAMKPMTYTGCVEAGSGGAYMLSHSMMMGGKMMKDKMGKDTMGKDHAMEMSSPMKMMAPDSMKMSAHVGHKVQVTGTMDKMGMMQVKSMKMMSTTCP